MPGDLNFIELDCIFKDIWLSLDEPCTQDLPSFGTFEQNERYVRVLEDPLDPDRPYPLGYDMDRSREYGPDILYVCGLTFGNVQLSVRMSHQVIAGNYFFPEFDGSLVVIYEVFEGDDPKTFHY